MGAHARHDEDAVQQLALYEPAVVRDRAMRARSSGRGEQGPRMCAACKAHEARYGFTDRQNDDPLVGRPKTLCFECFRMEVDRRQAVAEQRARGWNATQAALPLASRLDALHRRRRRAQIAARRAVGVR
jgi:hypothetical protein